MDDSLLEYFEACTFSSSDEDLSYDSLNDEDGLSPWRAASGDSPLRGRARLRSPLHRSGLMQRRLREDSRASGRSHRRRDLQPLRGEEARCAAALLAHPIGVSPNPRATAAAQGSNSNSGDGCGYRTDGDRARERRRADRELRDAYVFDALCALRLEETRLCHRVVDSGGSGTGRHHCHYALRPGARAALVGRGWLPFVAALERILSVATDVAALQAQLAQFHDAVRRIGQRVDVSALVGSALGGDEAAAVASVDATTALGAAALSSLFRFGVFARNMLRVFKNWVLEVQELSAGIRAAEADASGAASLSLRSSSSSSSAGAGLRKMQRMEGGRRQPPPPPPARGKTHPTGEHHNDDSGGFSTTAPSLLELLAAVEDNAAPLLRLLTIAEESGCYSGMWEWAQEAGAVEGRGSGQRGPPAANTRGGGTSPGAATANAFADECADLAAGLLDHLIVRLSALQDTSSMDLYRVYMILLLHCAWPYVLLSTATICGLVHGLDPQRWRWQLPRLFRSSFSHIRVGDARRRYPTDILSLLLNCVGYESPDGDGDSSRLLGGPGATGHLKALSALGSSRRFVLRCFATFAQKKSRRREKRRTAAAAAVVAPVVLADIGAAPLDGGQRVRALAAKMDIASVGSMSVGEILGELVRDTATEDGREWEALFLPEHILLERQTRQREEHLLQGGEFGAASAAAAVAAQVTAQTSVAVLFPPAVPLGFSAVNRDVAGQAEWRRAVAQRHQRDALPLFTTSASDDDNYENGRGDSSDGSGGGRPRRGQSGALWCLRVSDPDSAADILLIDRNEAAWLAAGGGPAARGRTDKDLWLNTTIPAARWITAALLIPIGVVVQQLHERRLELLFRRSLAQRSSGHKRSPFDRGPDSDDDGTADDGAAAAAATILVTGADGRVLGGQELHRLLGGRQHHHPQQQRGGQTALLVHAPASFSFLHAVKLLLDVALCRDKPRLVEGFLEGLHQEPHWWFRRQTRTTGTCSDLISFLFADALRGKRYGDLVTLTVLPRVDRHHSAAAATADDDDMYLAREMLDVFASFQLSFAFPDELALVLLPTELCVSLRANAAGGHDDWEEAVEQRYSTFFWERRRGRYDPTAVVTRGPGKEGGREPARGPPSGIPAADVWSYFFGYLCSMHMAQITLREQRKALHVKDTQDHELLAVVGAARADDRPPPAGPTRTPAGGIAVGWIAKARAEAGARAEAAAAAALARRAPLTMVSRGLGSAYFALSFALDAVLSFTLREASVVIYRLERTLAQTEACSSVMQLCQQIDTLLLSLQVVCFPARPPVPSASSSSPAAVPGPTRVVEEVRGAMTTILALSLDPSRMPVRLLSARSRNAIEALVALVSGLGDLSVLKSRLRPLLVTLTFNCFYGWEGQADYQFR